MFCGERSAPTGYRKSCPEQGIIFRIFITQGIVVLLTAAVFRLQGTVSFLSALSGGMVCILPGLYFAWRLFSHRGASATRQIIGDFYRGEAGKFVLTALLFAAVFINVEPLDFAALMTTFALAQLTYWWAPVVLLQRSKRV